MARICVINGVFPTDVEPYNGAAVWETLEVLGGLIDLEIFCVAPGGFLGSLGSRFLPRTPAAALNSSSLRWSLHKYPSVPGFSRMFNGRLIYESLRKAAGQLIFDAVLTYRAYPEGYAALLLARSLGLPLIIGSRGTDINGLSSNPLIRYAVRRTIREAAAILCVSDELADKVRELGGRAERVNVIHNGCDPSVFRFRQSAVARKELRVSPSQRLILYVGRLHLKKGLENLLSAVAKLCRDAPQEWQLVGAGEGPARRGLESVAVELGIQDRVRLLGKQSSSQVATWMCAADILCLPSESEGCPNVVVEALSCGCPVVATNVGAIHDLVDGNSGVILKTNQADEIAAGLRRAALRDWDRPAIALDRSRTWKEVGHETAAIIHTVLTGRNGVSDRPAAEASETA